MTNPTAADIDPASISDVALPGRAAARKWTALVLPVVLFGALALVPVAARFGTESFILSIMTRVVVLGIAALALDLLIGVAGITSFGHAAYLGIGAYAVAILGDSGVTDLGIQAGTALCVAAVFALLTGAISLRTNGVYFIMITLAFGQMAFFVATSLSAYGGDDGVTLGDRSTVFGTDLLRGDGALYWASLACLLVVYCLGRRLVASRFGRVLTGVRESAIRMEAIGFRPFPFQLTAFVISGMVTALAGVLLANQSGFVSPAMMTWQRSGDLIFMVVLGGVGSLHGAVLGAVAFILTEEVLSHLTSHWRILFGPLLIIVVLFARGGLAGIFRVRP